MTFCRVAIWPEVRRFMEALPTAAAVADVGCGNGKYFDVRPDLAVLGSDRSSGLVQQAMRRVVNVQAQPAVPLADVLVADAMALPFRLASMDAVLCIAVLHHISSPARRRRFLSHLAALLVPGGRAIVTVWATEQEKPEKTVRKWTPISLPCRENQGQPGAAPQSPVGCARGADGTLDTPSEGLGGGVAGEACGQQRVRTTDGNYFVPWHVPFHRAAHHLAAINLRDAEAAAGATGWHRQGARPSADQGQLRSSSPPSSHTSRPQDDADNGPTASREEDLCVSGTEEQVGEVDNEKGTVVFKRYYHLFAPGELASLVKQVPGVRLCSTVFDASNWVAVFEKLPG